MHTLDYEHTKTYCGIQAYSGEELEHNYSSAVPLYIICRALRTHS